MISTLCLDTCSRIYSLPVCRLCHCNNNFWPFISRAEMIEVCVCSSLTSGSLSCGPCFSRPAHSRSASAGERTLHRFQGTVKTERRSGRKKKAAAAAASCLSQSVAPVWSSSKVCRSLSLCLPSLACLMFIAICIVAWVGVFFFFSSSSHHCHHQSLAARMCFSCHCPALVSTLVSSSFLVVVVTLAFLFGESLTFSSLRSSCLLFSHISSLCDEHLKSFFTSIPLRHRDYSRWNF